MFYLFIIAVVPYLILALWLWRGWAMLPRFDIAGASISVSVVIYMRNKASNIRHLLSDIANQHYSQGLIQVVVVDDHSTDHSATEVEDFAKKYPNVELLRLPEGKYGKKAALRHALSHLTGMVVVTTDANCRATPRWLATIAAFYATYNPSMIICPVLYTYGQSFFSRWQAIKQIRLMGLAAATAAWRHPVLCSGTNLAIDRSVMERYAYMYDRQPASSEDMMMMLEIKKNPLNRVFFLKSTGAVISTTPPSDLKSFISQYIRPIFKYRAYTNLVVIIVALIDFIANLSVLACLVAGFFQLRFLWLAAILWMVKMLVNWLFLKMFSCFWNKYLHH